MKVHLTPKISDHCLLSINLKNYKHYPSKTTIFKRCMKDYSTDYLQNSLLDTAYGGNTGSVDSMANSFTESINFILDEMCPVKKITFKQKYSDKEWIIAEIKELMNKRDPLYSKAVYEKTTESWNEFKKLEISL